MHWIWVRRNRQHVAVLRDRVDDSQRTGLEEHNAEGPFGIEQCTMSYLRLRARDRQSTGATPYSELQ